MLWFRAPEKVYIKKGCLPVALDELRTVRGAKKAFIVTDTFLYQNGYTKPITDKLDEHLRTLWEEFYSHIGVSSLLVQKRERVIRDEMRASMGGTIASRYIRFNPRKIALEKIKKLWGYDIELEFYDGLPTTIEETFRYLE